MTIPAQAPLLSFVPSDPALSPDPYIPFLSKICAAMHRRGCIVTEAEIWSEMKAVSRGRLNREGLNRRTPPPAFQEALWVLCAGNIVDYREDYGVYGYRIRPYYAKTNREWYI